MNEKTTRNLLITLVVLVLTGLTYFVVSDAGSNNQKAQNNDVATVAQEETTEPKETAIKGKISGSYTYPGEKIPQAMRACAEDSETRQKVACASEQIVDEQRFIYGAGYEIELDPGKYYVYVDQGETKAYFNGYAAQVTKEDGWADYDASKCKTDYQPSLVTVEAGKETADTVVADWYYEANCN